MAELEPYYAEESVSLDTLPSVQRAPVHVVLDNLRSAYNVGSAFRTSDAAAVEHVYLCGMSAHPPHPKLDKTALGAQDYIPWSYHERTMDAIRLIQGKGIPVVAVEIAEGAANHFDFDWPKPVAVVFGNEVTGVPERVLKHCDHCVQIPMRGYKNSINVATAFGIVLYEIIRRWNMYG